MVLALMSPVHTSPSDLLSVLTWVPSQLRRVPAASHSANAARRSGRTRPGCGLRSFLLLGLLLGLCSSLVSIPAEGASAPSTRRRAVTVEYQGQKVVDEYLWLEEGTNAAVRAWTAAQNKYARGLLDASEARPGLERRLRELAAKSSADYAGLIQRGPRLFFYKSQPPAQQPVLMVLQGTNHPAHARVVLDPNRLRQDGGTSIDWFIPSPDGRLVAVSLSEGGSELGTLHLYEAETGRELADRIPRVHGPTAGGSAEWNGDGTGLYYTRYPAAGERAVADGSFYQQVYFHRVGTAVAEDRYEIGREFPRIAEVELSANPDHSWMLAKVANGDGGEYAHWVRSPAGEWRQVTRFEDGVSDVRFGKDPAFIEWPRDHALYLLSHKGAPNGQVLRLPLGQPGAGVPEAKLVVEEGTNAISGFVVSAGGMYVSYLSGGPMELVFYDFTEDAAWLLAPIAPQRGRGAAASTNGPVINPITVSGMVVVRGDELYFRTEGFTEPYRWQHYNPNRDRGVVEITPFSGESPVDFSDIEVVQNQAVSKDGTRVPLTILRKKGTRLNGANPALLTGYGGYGISLTPQFDPTTRVWFDQGGVMAVAHLRGGGEFGENWHHGGSLVRKQNVFDDFEACARLLLASNYTSPERLAIEGGSNGGLLMGAALTQHPELYRAVVSHVGIYDMLRVEQDPNGSFNVTEFGSVQDPAQYAALRAYSPYHAVRNAGSYPAVLLLTGENDGRVNPAHSRKMTARLQGATASKRPVLLRTSGSTGHGIGTPLDERIEELADVYSFLLDQLGIFYSEVDRGPWSGGVTPTQATVKAKLGADGMKARLVFSEDRSLRRAASTALAISSTNHGNIVSFPLEGLKPGTRYYYALEVNGRLDRSKAGQLRTFEEAPTGFSVAFASCARTGSTSDVFDRIREHDPVFYMNMGDFHYQNIATNLPSRFRAAYDLVLGSPQQAELYRNVPFVYMWDDHDFGGNNVGRSSRSHVAARNTYQEYVPHYPLAGGEGNVAIYQSFNVGRVKFILTDLRSERDSVTNKDDANKSMMGSAQKAWFKKELLAANGKYPLICWVSTVPWLGVKGTNYYRAVGSNDFGYFHHTALPPLPPPAAEGTNASRRGGAAGGRAGGRRPGTAGTDEDHWSVYATERREICDFIKENHISGVCILHGDSHMIAADDGSNGDFATGGGVRIPVLCGAPLDQEPSLKGGPYSQGVYKVRRNEGCFGLLTITDRGTGIDVAYSGRNNKDEEKISLRFSVPASPPPPAASGRARTLK